MMADTHCEIELPTHYRWQEFAAFHGRDGQGLAECLDQEGRSLHKALLLQGEPACLQLSWDERHVAVQLHGTAAHQYLEQAELQAMSRRMLGLAYPPQALDAAHGRHPELGPLLARQAGLHVPGTPTPFEALTWAIMGQQISVAVAISLRRKLIALAGVPLNQAAGGPLLAYPDAARVARLDVESLRANHFSQAKAQTLLAVAQAVTSGQLPLDDWAAQSAAGWSADQVQEVEQRLLAIKGIGPWTVNYTLLRGYGWPDGSLHGDVAVRRAIGLLLQKTKPDAAEARIWLDQFQPWRALVAAHLWASLSNTAF